MNREAGSLEYAVTRMQYRLANRPTEAAWGSIEAARGIEPILATARGTWLAPLVAGLPPAPALEDVDRAARAAWSATVGQAREWMPPEWDAAIAWCDHGGPPAHPTLLPSLGETAWRERWPGGGEQAGLASLAETFAFHLAHFRLAKPHEAGTMRRAFEARLLGVVRRHPVEPAAAFAWLALVALDLERLRGELARRIAFPHGRLAA